MENKTCEYCWNMDLRIVEETEHYLTWHCDNCSGRFQIVKTNQKEVNK